MQKDNIDDRLAICLKTVRIKKQIIITKGEKKYEQTRTNRSTAKRLAR